MLFRSHDFQKLTLINGNSTDALRSFSYIDETLSDGDNHYRLKSVATDGTVQMSEIVTMRYAQPENYTLYPNPANDVVDIDLSDAQGKAVELSIINTIGKVLLTEKIESVGAPHHRLTLDNIENGQYFLKIQTQGKKVVMKKLVVIK